MSDAFFTLHRGLHREGPGEAADVHWALDVANVAPNARILDAACGPGADTVTLANSRPDATILGVDGVVHFVAEAKERVNKYNNINVLQGDMYEQFGPFDFIWCAGAVYFRGVTEALRAWKPDLSDGARIAFSDAVWLKHNPPKVLSEFWKEYGDMSDIAAARTRIKNAGYKVLGERVLADTAWQNYYGPMNDRIEDLRKNEVDQELAEVLHEAEVEYSMRRQYPEYYGYGLFVVTPE